MSRRLIGLSLLLSLLVSNASVAQTVSLPTGFYLEEVASNETFALPIGTEFAEDGRIFIVEKAGIVWIVENGVKNPTPFLDISTEVMDHHDRGLLSFALDPEFSSNGHVYLLYTFDRDGTGDRPRYDAVGRLTRYTVSSANPNVVDPTSRRVLIGETYAEGIPACFYSHAIGTVRFGHDGSLLLSAGDGAWYTKVDSGELNPTCFADGLDPVVEDIGAFRSISLQSMAGKILRIDPATGDGLPSNPFFTGNPSDIQSKIWARGLRNPYRFSVGTPEVSVSDGPGTLFVGDVGWLQWEELNVVRDGGENFGWPCYEGIYEAPEFQEAEPAYAGCETVDDHTPPTFWFRHGPGSLSYPTGLGGQAIVAGDMYRGTKYPQEYRNRLFYADYTRGWVSSTSVDDNGNLDGQWIFAQGIGPVVDWRYNPYDEYFYFVNVWTGTAMRVRHNNENRPPVAVVYTNATAGLLPFNVEFSSASSYDPDGDEIRFVWEFGDGQKSKNPNPNHEYATAGTYVAKLHVTDPSGATSTRSVTISAGNTLPEAIVHTPDDRTVVSVDDVLSLMGTGSDLQDNAKYLSYNWKIIARHNNHYHPDIYTAQTRYTEYIIEEHGVAEEVNYLEVNLIVTDSGGLSDTTTRYVEIRREGEFDVTPKARPMALVLGGTAGPDDPQNLEVIKDGIHAIPGSADPSMQFDTRSEHQKSEDWVGYEFDAPLFLSKLELYEGAHSPEGGWFDDFRVEVRAGGEWTEVEHLSSIAPYRGADNEDYGTYSLQFRAVFGDAIRLIGTPGGTDGYVSISELRAFALPEPAQNNLETVVVGDVSTDWTTVGVRNTYGNMVSVCSVAQSQVSAPLAVRMRRASGSSFDIRIQSTDSTVAVSPQSVHCVVTSAGTWVLPDGTRLRAAKYTSTQTDHLGSWIGEQQPALGDFVHPVVVGQVMTQNDSLWSAFWARGENTEDAPDKDHLFTGKHVGMDSTTARADEHIGYIAFERAHVEAGEVAFEAGTTNISLNSNSAHPTAFNESFSTAPRTGLVASAGMSTSSISWPSLSGVEPLSCDSLYLEMNGVQETPDSTATGSIAYVVFGSAATNHQLQVPRMAELPVVGTADEQVVPAPDVFDVEAVYPNPFQKSVTVRLAIPATDELRVDVFDVLGRRVATLLDSTLQPGLRDISWDGKTMGGSPAAPGIYFIVAKTGDVSIERKVVRTR